MSYIDQGESVWGWAKALYPTYKGGKRIDFINELVKKVKCSPATAGAYWHKLKTKADNPPEAWGSHELDNAQVGDGCTHVIWTDRNAGTIVEKTDRYIVMQEDDAQLVDGSMMSENQKYEFTPNPNAYKRKFTRRVFYTREGEARVVYKGVGTTTREAGNTLHAGRSTYRDPCF